MAGSTIRDFTGKFSSSPDTPLSVEDAEFMDGLLTGSRNWFSRLDDYRQRRRKSREYRRGRQWEETIADPDNEGQTITEREYIERQGRIAWVINQLEPIHRNLKGQYRQNRSSRIAFPVSKKAALEQTQINIALRSIRRQEYAKSLESDLFEEHILSGSAVGRVDIGWSPELNRNQIKLSSVHPARFFMNMDIKDRRLTGLRIIGELHDYTREELLAEYAVDEEGEYDETVAKLIEERYEAIRKNSGDTFMDEGTGDETNDEISFDSPLNPGMFRVIEIWVYEHEQITYAFDPMTGDYFESTDEGIEQANLQRQAANAEIEGQELLEMVERHQRYEPVWNTYHMTPEGDLLYSDRSPYEHEGHPYTVSLANLVDGEWYGLLETVIDPQRWFNRLVAMIDHAVASTAKGLLVVDRSVIPAEMSLEELGRTWSMPNGILVIDAKPGKPLPDQITRNAIPSETFAIFAMLKEWMQEASGSMGAVRGEEPMSGTPAALFQMQIMQASLTNLDWFETFFEFLHRWDTKILQTMLQAYEEVQFIYDEETEEQIEYTPQDVREVQWQMAMGQVTETATHKLAFEEDLQKWLEGGVIDFPAYLKFTGHPQGEALAKFMESRNVNQMAEIGQGLEGITNGTPPQ